MNSGVNDIRWSVARQEPAGRLAAKRILKQFLGGTDRRRTLAFGGIEHRTVSLDNLGHVLGALHAPFNLETHHTRISQLGQKLDRRKIVG